MNACRRFWADDGQPGSYQLADRARAIDPDTPEVHLAFGFLHANRYEYRRAAEEFQEATRLDPKNSMAWDYFSWALAYQEPPDAVSAEKASREALRLGATDMSAYYHFGRTLLLQNRYDEALAAFSDAKKASPKSDTPEYGMAQVYLAKKDYDRALEHLGKMSPEQRSTGLLQYFASAVHAGRGDKKEALEMLQTAFERGFRDFAALDASPHFAALRSDARFQQLVARYRK